MVTRKNRKKVKLAQAGGFAVSPYVTDERAHLAASFSPAGLKARRRAMEKAGHKPSARLYDGAIKLQRRMR